VASAAVMGGSGMNSGRFASAAAAFYTVWERILETPHQSAGGQLCFICIGYHWVSSKSSRKAEKRSNCEIGTNYCMNEGVMAGEGR
jgi:hypothetical protein